MIGKTLAHYTILDKIGEGGMGEVYRGRDTTLGREVAIKVLPAAVVADPERAARFEREAKVLASLNHPGIAAVYGFHEADGVRFLAMELVPGLDLGQRLARGPLSLDEALPTASRIAEALEYAHEHGIVHRDLKPANVKVGEGGVKVLDFGLAKAFSPDDGAGEPTSTPTLLPTVTSGGTRAGLILGTAAYMSPEQARGHRVDRRTDIWAFGCLLYEMLTGKLLFPGETVSDTIAAVLRADIDLGALPADTPEPVRRLLARCLDRNPGTRLRDIGEARILLGDPQASGVLGAAAADAGAVPSGSRRTRWWWWAAAALVAGMGIGRLTAPRETAAPAARFLFDIQDSTLAVGSLALSPDGTRLVCARRTPAGGQELALRRLDQEGIVALPGTQGGRQAFWSPDGDEIGFFIGDAVYRISLSGGGARQIASLPDQPMGGSWGANGVILVGTYGGPIYRVSLDGGAAEAVTALEPGSDGHVWPVFLPGGNRFVHLSDAPTTDGHKLHLRSLEGGDAVVLMTGVRSQFVLDPRGALIFADQGQLFASPFDVEGGGIADSRILVADGIQAAGDRHSLAVTASSGVLAMQHDSDSARLVRIPLDGSPREYLTSEPERIRNPRLSPDGRSVAFEIQNEGAERLVWVLDLERGSRTLISSRGVLSDSPVWSPDGEWIYFDSDADSTWKMYRKRVRGGGAPELLSSPGGTDLAVYDLSSDGRWVLARPLLGGVAAALFLGDLSRDPVAWTKWTDTSQRESTARFSPDGRWIAYASDATGVGEVYVAPTDGGPMLRRWMVSVNGGGDPAWSPSGDTLYYRAPDGMLQSVPLRREGGELVAGAPTPRFPVIPPSVSWFRNAYDVTPDGTAVVAFPTEAGTSPAIRVHTGWHW